MHTIFSDFRTMTETSHKLFLLFLFFKKFIICVFVCLFCFYIPTKVSPSSPPVSSSPSTYVHTSTPLPLFLWILFLILFKNNYLSPRNWARKTLKYLTCVANGTQKYQLVHFLASMTKGLWEFCQCLGASVRIRTQSSSHCRVIKWWLAALPANTSRGTLPYT